MQTAMLHSSSTHFLNENVASIKRQVLVAIDLSDQSLKALQWTLHEFYKPGDLLHIVHVNKCLQPQITIQHTYPGATYTIPNLTDFDENKHAQNIKDIIQSRFCSILEQRHIPHLIHLYLDTDNAPPAAVAETLFKVAVDCKAALLVLAAHNKAYGLTELLLGSVAHFCSQKCPVPLMVVRDFTNVPQKLVIPFHSPQTSPVCTPTHSARVTASDGGAAVGLGSPRSSGNGQLHRHKSIRYLDPDDDGQVALSPSVSTSANAGAPVTGYHGNANVQLKQCKSVSVSPRNHEVEVNAGGLRMKVITGSASTSPRYGNHQQDGRYSRSPLAVAGGSHDSARQGVVIHASKDDECDPMDQGVYMARLSLDDQRLLSKGNTVTLAGGSPSEYSDRVGSPSKGVQTMSSGEFSPRQPFVFPAARAKQDP